MSSSTSAPIQTDILDHIVFLSPPGTLSSTIQKFTDLGFNVLKGGSHADNLTSNALIILSSKVYIELIAFDHPLDPPSPPSPDSPPHPHYPPGSDERKARENHRWAHTRVSEGWIDFANLGTDEGVWKVVNERFGGGDGDDDGNGGKGGGEGGEGGGLYAAPVEGGRVTTEGKVLKWRVTPPVVSEDEVGKIKKVELPFFCEDITPREWRVPASEENVTHPSKVLAVSHLRYMASEETFESTLSKFTAIIGTPPSLSSSPSPSSPESQNQNQTESQTEAESQKSKEAKEASWSLNSPLFHEYGTTLHLSTPHTPAEVARATGLWEVGFWTEGGEEEKVVETGSYKISWKSIT
ncbi:hypothetical protein SISSUDRAFT_993798 [Sistotremastrum suecicum HHB10207 ss-3]|uniref:Glyoxalase-like domain-containing protein n=1 Tax=Sistotremastrum suecicum HHB10207 ss-3 TaxID=1314776 RepID=A0A165Y0A1_9AGAM|nr:hypothetical protein SISSUDRAFT_993798 [Sistotremastrum suecicum HHB10207 ss-3]